MIYVNCTFVKFNRVRCNTGVVGTSISQTLYDSFAACWFFLTVKTRGHMHKVYISQVRPNTAYSQFGTSKNCKYLTVSDDMSMAGAASKTPSFREITQITAGADSCVNYLRSLGLIRKQLQCQRCFIQMKLVQKSSLTSDGQVWRCSKCRTMKSIREASIFKVFHC